MPKPKRRVVNTRFHQDGFFYDQYGQPLDYFGRPHAAPREEKDPGIVPTPWGLVETPLFKERQGVQNVVRFEQLPKKDVEGEYGDLLKKLGFEIIGPSKDDRLFSDVKFPAGWTKERSKTDSRTTYLIDPDGHKRAYVWYKAASYDPAAYMVVRRRFNIQTRRNEECTEVTAYVTDEREVSPATPRVVHKTKTFKCKGIQEYEKTELEARKAAIEWKRGHLPDASDHCAYWNDEPLPEVCPFPAW